MKKIDTILYKMLNFNEFCTYVYLPELIFSLETFGYKGIRALVRPSLRSKFSAVCAKFPMGSKFHFFSQWKTYFIQFIDKFLKFEEMETVIYHIKLEIWLVLHILSILFSAVQLKLEHSLSQFIYRFKIETFESLT